MKESFFRNIKLLLISLLLLACGIEVSYPQTRISGSVNSYGRVTELGSDYAVLQDISQVSGFAAGDTVLLIQMKGGISIVDETANFGLPHDTIGAPGKYEFLIVDNVIPASLRINFRNERVNSYSVRGNLQIVKVPSFNSALVEATLTCEPWDSVAGTGGVLAMIVGRSLILNADIDVTGKGFRGGEITTGDGICVESNPSLYDKFGVPYSNTNSGIKGESQISLGLPVLGGDHYPIFPDYVKGKGNNFTGGGGGNGRFSGGGGGSNYGAGGRGGREMNNCEPPVDGGIGGRHIINSNMQGGIFPGSGGGSSTYFSGSSASPGARGGGIIIILCDTLTGNGHTISADGASASGASSNAGAGGGGGGGSAALHIHSFSNYVAPASTVNISAKGGKGGNNAGSFGEGGGGGGGLVWLKTTSLPSNVTVSVTGGLPGSRTGPSTALSGNTGHVESFEPVLTGFLFNSIRSSITGNQIDSVCSNNIPKRLTGTNPAGGVPPYSFRWEKSYDQTNWSLLYEGPDSINYTPEDIENATVFFRRIVTDSNTPALEDIGKPVMIVVHQYIKNNIIGNSDTICYGQTPSSLISLGTVLDGNGIYEFIWESSTDNISYTFASAGTESYQPPPGLTQTTWYRRTVTSARCIDTSQPVRIEVLEPISDNTILSPSQEICEGMLFDNLTATVPPSLTGGDNEYSYLWQRSNDGEEWENAEGINDQPGYDPAEDSPSFPAPDYYRRLVFSGSDDVCISASNSITLIKYSPVTNNILTTGDQTICSGSAPMQLTGSAPDGGKGAGSYTYTWQDSTGFHSWTDIVGFSGISDPDFNPGALTDTTGYRRIVISSACADTSLAVMINVHKPVTENIISLLEAGTNDTTICSGATPHRITGLQPSGGTDITGDYEFQWSFSSDNITWNDLTESANDIDYYPVALSSTTYFRRRVTSGECISESDPVMVKVLPLITGNLISGDPVVCRDGIPGPVVQLAATTLSGGEGTGSYTFLWEESIDGISWIPAAGINNAAGGSYQPPSLYDPMKYRRIVYSGPAFCCTSISNIAEISIDVLPEGTTINAGNDTTMYTFDYILDLRADPVPEGGTGKWTIAEGTGTFIDDTSNNTRVTGLSAGLNRLLWTVTKGACKLEDFIDIYVYEGLLIPEGFSPNNDPDNYNNTFEIKGLDLSSQIAELKVVNSAGAEVFASSNRNGEEWKSWDGKNTRGSDLPEGTYYYLLRITSKVTGKVFRKSGFIILKRY